ncbi:hypothetical protein Tco_0835630 [Tanacetum coccineum]
MEISIADQIALDDALVSPADRLKIEDDISWKSSDDDQDDEKAQDDEDEDKYDVNETTQDDEDDDVHGDDENAQDDDDEEQSESEDDGDDFIHPKLTTHDDEIIHEEETDEDDTFDPIVHTPSHISSSDDEDSDNEVEGTNVEGAKSDEDATYEEDQGNEAVKDTNTNLEGRDDVMTDVILPQVQATQEIEDTHVTLTPVNPDGQQQSSSVSSGFVSNMLNPNQDTGVDAIFGQHSKAKTSLIILIVTAIAEPSFSAPTNHPPTSNPLIIQIITPTNPRPYIRLLLPRILTSKSFLTCFVRQLKGSSTRPLVYAMKAEKFCEIHMHTVTIKRPRDGTDDDQEPSVGTDQGSKKKEGQEKEPASITSAPKRNDNHDEQERLLHRSTTTTENLDWINPEGPQYPHDLGQPLTMWSIPKACWKNLQLGVKAIKISSNLTKPDIVQDPQIEEDETLNTPDNLPIQEIHHKLRQEEQIDAHFDRTTQVQRWQLTKGKRQGDKCGVFERFVGWEEPYGGDFNWLLQSDHMNYPYVVLTLKQRLFKDGGGGPDSSWLTRSIATCSYPTDKHKDIMKAQVHVSRLLLL